MCTPRLPSPFRSPETDESHRKPSIDLQVPLKHHRRNGDPICVGCSGTIEQIFVHAAVQWVPKETRDPGDRLLGRGGRRQREQSRSVGIDGKLGVRGQTVEELGKRKGQTSRFVWKLRETRTRGRFPTQREAKGRKSAGAGKGPFSSSPLFTEQRNPMSPCTTQPFIQLFRQSLFAYVL